MKPRRKFRHAGENRAKRASEALADSPVNSPAEETRGPRRLIEQAARDISRGLRDTDLHGTPSNVPGPGPAPEQSPGAEVPAEGVDAHK